MKKIALLYATFMCSQIFTNETSAQKTSLYLDKLETRGTTLFVLNSLYASYQANQWRVSQGNAGSQDAVIMSTLNLIPITILFANWLTFDSDYVASGCHKTAAALGIGETLYWIGKYAYDNIDNVRNVRLNVKK